MANKIRYKGIREAVMILLSAGYRIPDFDEDRRVFTAESNREQLIVEYCEAGYVFNVR